MDEKPNKKVGAAMLSLKCHTEVSLTLLSIVIG